MAGQEPDGNGFPEVWRYDAPSSTPQPPPSSPTAHPPEPIPPIPPIPPVGPGSGRSRTGGHRRRIAVGVALAVVAAIAAGAFVLLRAGDERVADSSDADGTQVAESAGVTDQAGSSAVTSAADQAAAAATNVPSDSARVDRTPERGTATPVPSATVVPETGAPATNAPATVPAATLIPLTTQPPPPTLSAPRIVEAAASSTRPDATDGCDPPNPTTYSATQLFDRFTDSAWMTAGSGVGANIVFTLEASAKVSRVGLIAGYDKVDPCRGSDRFIELRRIVRVRWTFDDGMSVDQLLDPTVRTVQYLPLAPAVTTSTVQLTILETTAPGNGTLDYTPISEVEIL